MKLPEKVYRLVVRQRGEDAGRLQWSEVGSKTYNSKAEALKRLDNFRSRGVECYLYESDPLVWKILPEGK